MDTNCIQCPPVSYPIHDKCHEQYIVHLKIIEGLENKKENTHPFFTQNLNTWRLALTSFFQLCETNEDFIKYEKKIREFNTLGKLIVLDHINVARVINQHPNIIARERL